MAKYIRRFLICLILVAAIVFTFLWKDYQKKVECRENALIYFQEEDYQKAIQYLEEGLDDMNFFSKEIDKDMSCYLAESYYQLGESEKAVKLYDELIESNPKEKIYYLMKGDSLLSKKHSEEAVKVFDEGFENTGDIVFLERICDSYMDEKDYEKALIYAEQGRKVSQKSDEIFLFKEIVIYERANDYQSAYEKAKEYTELYPEEEKGKKEYIFLSTRI